MPIKSLFIFSLIFILTGCGDSEVKEQEAHSMHDPYQSYDQYDHWKAITGYVWDNGGNISLRDIDFDGEVEWILLFKERGNRHYKEYKAFEIEGDDISPGDFIMHYREDAVFDPETKTVINQWSSNACTHETLTYEAKDQTLALVKREFSDYEIFGNDCFQLTYEGESEEDLRLVSLECSNRESNSISFEECDDFTAEIRIDDDNNKQDILYLIYGHDFSHRDMSYKDGKLEGVSTYYDKGGNPVLLEVYKDGDLIDQSSGAHIVSGEGIE